MKDELKILRDHIAQMDVGSTPERLRERILRRIDRMINHRLPKQHISPESEEEDRIRRVVRDELDKQGLICLVKGSRHDEAFEDMVFDAAQNSVDDRSQKAYDHLRSEVVRAIVAYQEYFEKAGDVIKVCPPLDYGAVAKVQLDCDSEMFRNHFDKFLD